MLGEEEHARRGGACLAGRSVLGGEERAWRGGACLAGRSVLGERVTTVGRSTDLS